MSNPDDDPDREAAEYVLGTLDGVERAAAEARRTADKGFDTDVAAWESRLAPLIEAIRPIEPPPTVYAALMARLFGSQAPEASRDVATVVALGRSVRRWRVATAVVGAIAAALLAWIVIAPPRPASGRFVAVLQRDANAPAIVLDVDVSARTLSIRPVSTEAPGDKSLELWLINPELGGPRSLGLLSPNGVTRASLTPYDAAVIARATYAVTVEPPGGSPTGAPSSAPILSGKLVASGP